MSYDLLVFDPAAAPTDRAAFLDWYAATTDWDSSLAYDDPDRARPAIRSWYEDASREFPPLTASPAPSLDQEARVTDYSIGASFVYVAFAWSVAAEAFALCRRLAEARCLGLFNVSSPSTEIYLPNATGRLVPSSADFRTIAPFQFAIWKRAPTAKTAMLAECFASIQAGLSHDAMAVFDAAPLEQAIREHFQLDRSGTSSAVRVRTQRTETASSITVTTTPAAMPDTRDFIVPAALELSLMVFDPQAGAVWGNRRPPKPVTPRRR